MKTVAFCEIDPYCRKVLNRHWPEVKIHEDVKQLDGTQYAGAVDVICGGYPCQPFSEAGKKLGEQDARHLWPEMHRIIREARPRWVLAENVRGHVSLGFDQVAAQLEDDGFTVWPTLVPACAVDAPHRRERLWIVAHAQSIRRNHGHDSQLQRQSTREIHAPTSSGSDLDRLEARRWEDEPAVARVAHGIPSRVDRIRALGNAVVPQIPERIGRAIIQYEASLAA